MTIPGGWLGVLTIGIILGALGQGARAIVGFKKLNDDNDTQALFDGVRLLVSFGIGGVAGALAALTVLPTTGDITRDQLIGIAAAGYTGSDFIEGFISRFNGGDAQKTPDPGTPAPANSPDGAVG
jgi:hypothetical protein